VCLFNFLSEPLDLRLLFLDHPHLPSPCLLALRPSLPYHDYAIALFPQCTTLFVILLKLFIRLSLYSSILSSNLDTFSFENVSNFVCTIGCFPLTYDSPINTLLTWAFPSNVLFLVLELRIKTVMTEYMAMHSGIDDIRMIFLVKVVSMTVFTTFHALWR
jgi:hypothetical protein